MWATELRLGFDRLIQGFALLHFNHWQSKVHVPAEVLEGLLPSNMNRAGTSEPVALLRSSIPKCKEIVTISKVRCRIKNAMQQQ